MGISVVNLFFMRGWVGVKNPGCKKMAEMISLQGFYDFFVGQPSAHLIQQEFRLFCFLTQFLKWTIIVPSAQLNLENYIYIGFQHPAIAISTTPY
jgi:hypothetical protein